MPSPSEILQSEKICPECGRSTGTPVSFWRSVRLSCWFALGMLVIGIGVVAVTASYGRITAPLGQSVSASMEEVSPGLTVGAMERGINSGAAPAFGVRRFDRPRGNTGFTMWTYGDDQAVRVVNRHASPISVDSTLFIGWPLGPLTIRNSLNGRVVDGTVPRTAFVQRPATEWSASSVVFKHSQSDGTSVSTTVGLWWFMFITAVTSMTYFVGRCLASRRAARFLTSAVFAVFALLGAIPHRSESRMYGSLNCSQGLLTGLTIGDIRAMPDSEISSKAVAAKLLPPAVLERIREDAFPSEMNRVFQRALVDGRIQKGDKISPELIAEAKERAAQLDFPLIIVVGDGDQSGGNSVWWGWNNFPVAGWNEIEPVKLASVPAFDIRWYGTWLQLLIPNASGGPWSLYSVIVPRAAAVLAGVLLVPSLFLLMIVVIFDFKQRRWTRRGACKFCGYDLSAHTPVPAP